MLNNYANGRNKLRDNILANNGVEITVSKMLAPLAPAIKHGFLGRRGGISTGIYEGLNIALGSADDQSNILENRRRATEAVMPSASLARMYQTHSPDVFVIEEPTSPENPPRADAMVTRTPGILLGISTADCVPVLFADAEAMVVGAAHSGWKGAVSGVNENTIIAMERLGADRNRIICAIGPCIAQKSYEVDAAFHARFMDEDVTNEHFFREGKPGHFQFDLEAYVMARLARAGIKKVEALGEDTYSQPDRYYSYRRSCHLGHNGYGTQISLIGIEK